MAAPTARASPADKTRRLAYHEAGHAVIAHLVGATIEYVTIDAALIEGIGPTLGHTQTVDLDQGPVESLVMVGLAGSLAEAREMGDAKPLARMAERRRITELLQMAKVLGKRQGPPGITAAEEASVSQMLTAYWPAVVAVATALIASPTLSGNDVPGIVRRAVPPTPWRPFTALWRGLGSVAAFIRSRRRG